MKKKFVKYDELFDNTVRVHMERYFKLSYRRDWYISEIAKLGEKWIIKWERNLL